MVKILSRLEETFLDYPDNVSEAICVVFLGCTHNCKGCQNPHLQNPNVKETDDILDIDDENDFFDILDETSERVGTKKIVLTGGDPLSPYNIQFTKNFLYMNNYDFDVCVYTGYDIDYVKENGISGFQFIKCGKFDLEHKQKSEKTDEKMVFASPNQKLYDKDFNLISKDGIYYFNQGEK